jgi:hypothetical protein
MVSCLLQSLEKTRLQLLTGVTGVECEARRGKFLSGIRSGLFSTAGLC